MDSDKRDNDKETGKGTDKETGRETGKEAGEVEKINKEELEKLVLKASKRGVQIITDWAQRIGTPVLVGYGAFIGGMFFLPFIDMMFIRPSLYEVFELAGCAILAWIALASIVLPQLWKNPKSYYAYATPVVALALALLKASISASGAASTLAQFTTAPSAGISLILDAVRGVSFGIGFWVVTSSAIWLAYKGITKGRQLRLPISTS